MPKSTNNSHGFSLISGLVGAALIATIVIPLTNALNNKQKGSAVLTQRLIATGYISELAELFRAHTEDSFTNYLRDPSRANYFYCSHINLLDRQNNKILNPDPISNLPNPANLTAANRYYQVAIVDIKNPLVVSAGICGQSFNAVRPSTDERYLVSVGLGWQDATKGTNDIVSTSLSVLIPSKVNYTP